MNEPRKALDWIAFDRAGRQIAYTPFDADFAYEVGCLVCGAFEIKRTGYAGGKRRPWTLFARGIRETNNFLSYQSAVRAAERKAFNAEVSS